VGRKIDERRIKIEHLRGQKLEDKSDSEGAEMGWATASTRAASGRLDI